MTGLPSIITTTTIIIIIIIIGECFSSEAEK
jgi:hypothetical protein